MAPDWYGRPYHVAVIWLGVRHRYQFNIICGIVPYSALLIRSIPVSVRVLMHFPVQPALFLFHQQGIDRNLRKIRIGSSLRVLEWNVFSQDWGLESSLEPMDSTSLCSDLSVMFLDSSDKTLSLGRSEPGSPDNILYFGCPNIVSTDKSSFTGSKVPVSPDIVSSPDERSKLGSYSSLASVNCTFLVKLDFDLTLTSSVAWNWVDVPRSVIEVLNKTSFRH